MAAPKPNNGNVVIADRQMTTPEARGCVYACLGAEDPATAVLEMLGDIERVTNPDALKVAQFVLTIPAAKIGMQRYLDDPYRVPKSEKDVIKHTIHQGIADKSGECITQALHEDPNRFLAMRINDRRVDVLKERGRDGDVIRGIFSVIPKAAMSAAITTTTAAHLTASELHESGEFEGADRADFIAAVKSNGAVERAITRVHLGQVMVAHWAFETLVEDTEYGDRASSPNAEAISVSDGSVRLNRGLQHWSYPVARLKSHVNGRLEGRGYKQLGARELRDARIGCLLSFAPALVTAYYRQHVDLLEAHNLWPECLQRT